MGPKFYPHERLVKPIPPGADIASQIELRAHFRPLNIRNLHTHHGDDAHLYTTQSLLLIHMKNAPSCRQASGILSSIAKGDGIDHCSLDMIQVGLQR